MFLVIPVRAARLWFPEHVIQLALGFTGGLEKQGLACEAQVERLRTTTLALVEMSVQFLR